MPQRVCPLLTLTKVLWVLSPTAIVRAVSVIHQCTSTCVADFMRVATRTERQRITENTLRLKHDRSNTMYCYSVYCTGVTIHLIDGPTPQNFE